MSLPVSAVTMVVMSVPTKLNVSKQQEPSNYRFSLHRYYVEALFQEYSWVASVDVGLFKERSIFTPQQTAEAINEVQVIQATSDIVEERQVSM